MFCSKCGKELGENEKFCPECGIPAGTAPFQNGEDAAYAESKVHYNKTGGGVPIHNYDPRFDYTPIGMWGYFFYNILFLIPLVGQICCIIFALGATRNIHLRNYARSFFCVIIVVIVLLLLISLFGIANMYSRPSYRWY